LATISSCGSSPHMNANSSLAPLHTEPETMSGPCP
jgi:hypothetical protein